MVGASKLGAFISGEDSEGNLTVGTAVVTGGLAKFWVTYPANRDSLLVGCYGYENALPSSYRPLDLRFADPRSAQVYVIASSSDYEANTISMGQFCFIGIADATLDATYDASSNTVLLHLVDGGDKIDMPFVPVYVSVTIDKLGGSCDTNNPQTGEPYLDKGSCEGAGGNWVLSDFNITVDPIPLTNTYGETTATLSLNGANTYSGDQATVTFEAADASASVTITLP